MAAAQTPGTPSPAPVDSAAPDPAVGGGQESGAAETQDTPAEVHKVGSPGWVKQMADAKKAKRAAKGKESAQESGEETEGDEPEKTDDKGDVSAEALFTPEALSTPEGIDRARKILLFAKEDFEKTHMKADRGYSKLRIAQRALDADKANVQDGFAKIQRVQKYFTEKMAMIRGERTAQPMAICAALDELSGGRGDPEAGRQLLESMILAVGRDGKEPTETASEKRFRTQIEEMKAERQREREEHASRESAHEIAQKQHWIQSRELEIGTHAASNPGQFPAIAERIAAGRTTAAAVGKYVADLIQDAAENGDPLDAAQAIGILEERLTLTGGRPAQAETSTGQLQSV